MQRITLFFMLSLALPLLPVYAQHDDAQVKPEQKETCRDGFFVRTIKKYPKLTAACIVIPFVALLCHWYCLMDENQELELMLRQCATMKESLEKTVAERDEFIRTTFLDINQKFDLLGLGKKLAAQE